MALIVTSCWYCTLVSSLEGFVLYRYRCMGDRREFKGRWMETGWEEAERCAAWLCNVKKCEGNAEGMRGECGGNAEGM